MRYQSFSRKICPYLNTSYHPGKKKLILNMEPAFSGFQKKDLYKLFVQK